MIFLIKNTLQFSIHSVINRQLKNIIMRKVLLTGIFLVASVAGFAQTILSGSEVFGKDRKEGFYMTLNIEKKIY